MCARIVHLIDASQGIKVVTKIAHEVHSSEPVVSMFVTREGVTAKMYRDLFSPNQTAAT